MENTQLIQALNNCAAHCDYCSNACLEEDNVKDMTRCIKLDRACSTVCKAVADLLAFNYADVKSILEYCMNICEKCADECSKHEHQHCKDCADACNQCLEACKKYLQP